MRYKFLTALFSAMTLSSLAAVPTQAGKVSLPKTQLWYLQPASSWEKEALPLGNGRLGLMAFGGVAEDRFALNESTIWSRPDFSDDPAGSKDYSRILSKARALLFKGETFEAQKILQEKVLRHERLGGYEPLGDLWLRFKDLSGAVEGYRRELDLDTALHTMSFSQHGVTQSRQAFVSAADDVMVVELKSSLPGGLNFVLGLTRQLNVTVTALGADGLVMKGQAGSLTASAGTKFEAQVLAFPQGPQAKLEAVEGALRVSHADSVLLLLGVATDYNPEQPRLPKAGDFAAGLEDKLRELSTRGYASLREAHVKAHQALFRDMSLNLGTAKEAALSPTDQRLEAYKKGAADPELEALYFQYGRYMLISSSRGGPLPANLQGLWNEYIEAPWGSDFHININLQMNYWHAEAAGLQACVDPYFHFLETMRPEARLTAKEFGCAGFAAGHTTDAWGTARLSGHTQWGMWVTGLAWCGQHFMEHYRYSQDRNFLSQRAWPYMKESAEFLLDWLVEDPKSGKLVSGPAISPENEYFDAKWRTVNVSMGPSMDQEIIWETFSNVLEAAAALGLAKDPFVIRVKQAREKLARPGIAQDGRLMEWAAEQKELDPGHRHISHLFGVYPGKQFSFESTPDLMAAAKKSLEYRLAHGGGHTGWSRAWIINYWARFHETAKAYENFRLLLTNSTLPNLFDTHPPFQIDGNFGGAAAIMEMLLQSQNGELNLLPALPAAWKEGSVRGLRARGGWTVDMDWSAGSLKKAVIHSAQGGLVTLRYGARSVRYQVQAGRLFELKL